MNPNAKLFVGLFGYFVQPTISQSWLNHIWLMTKYYDASEWDFFKVWTKVHIQREQQVNLNQAHTSHYECNVFYFKIHFLMINTLLVTLNIQCSCNTVKDCSCPLMNTVLMWFTIFSYCWKHHSNIICRTECCLLLPCSNIKQLLNQVCLL